MSCECRREPDPGTCDGCSASPGSHCRCWQECEKRAASDDQLRAARILFGLDGPRRSAPVGPS